MKKLIDAEILSNREIKKGIFDSAIVNSSRGIIAAWKSEKYAKLFKPAEYALAAREAALRMRAELREELEAGKLS